MPTIPPSMVGASRLANLSHFGNERMERLVVETFSHLADWRMKSVDAFRNAAMSYGEGRYESAAGFIANPVLALDGQSDEEVFSSALAVQDTVAQGRLIDFGYLPNETIKTMSLKARAAFEAGDLIMPFPAFVGFYQWEGGSSALYVLRPPGNSDTPRLIVTEFYGLNIPHLPGIISAHASLILYDLGVVWPSPGDTRVTLSPLQPGMEDATVSSESRVGNLLDTLVTMLALMNDASVAVNVVEAPKALNKARAKHGRFPIPPHVHVDTKPYVTALKAHARAVTEGRGGTHASPIAHWRRAHHRTLASGTVVRVRASKVNFRDEGDFKRLFYRLNRER